MIDTLNYLGMTIQVIFLMYYTLKAASEYTGKKIIIIYTAIGFGMWVAIGYLPFIPFFITLGIALFVYKSRYKAAICEERDLKK